MKIRTGMGLVVGIGGVSRAGKSTLSNSIKSWLEDRTTIILDMDDFVFAEETIPVINDGINWEIPESVDFERIRKKIEEVREQYDYVIVEGILIFYDLELNGLYNNKIFVDISHGTFLQRKSRDSRWDEPEWYIKHIWDCYLTYGRNNSNDALVLDGTKEFDESKIIEFLK